MKHYLPAALLTTLVLAGCHNQGYYDAPAPPPPPPVAYRGGLPPLVQLADRNGFRAGFDDGNRDLYYHAGYDPRRNPAYAEAPGYDYRLGPIPPYVDAFRIAYLRGYDKAFYRNR